MNTVKHPLKELEGRTVPAIIAALMAKKEENQLAASKRIIRGYASADQDQRDLVDGLLRALTGHELGEIIAIAGDQKPLLSASISIEAGSTKA